MIPQICCQINWLGAEKFQLKCLGFYLLLPPEKFGTIFPTIDHKFASIQEWHNNQVKQK